MLFAEVIAQDSIKRYLRDAVDKDRLPHALLFLGENGYGTLAMALATAQFLMCSDRTHLDACGLCRNCHKAEKFIHPDIHFSFPTIGSKITSADLSGQWRQFLTETPFGSVQDWLSLIGGDNKQGNINKDECQRILRALSLKTYEGSYKVHLLWMAEYLGKEGNRLLKIIEEPPDQTVFILMAENQEDILNTIISRCQIVSFAALSDQEVNSYLRQNFPDADQDSLMQTTFLADGNIGKALREFGDTQNLSSKRWLEWMRLTYKGHPLSMVRWANEFGTLDRESQKVFLHYGLHFLREMLIVKSVRNRHPRILESEKTAFNKLIDLVTIETLTSMIALIDRSIFHLERNGSTKMIMLDNAIKMHSCFKTGMISAVSSN